MTSAHISDITKSPAYLCLENMSLGDYCLNSSICFICFDLFKVMFMLLTQHTDKRLNPATSPYDKADDFGPMLYYCDKEILYHSSCVYACSNLCVCNTFKGKETQTDSINMSNLSEKLHCSKRFVIWTACLCCIACCMMGPRSTTCYNKQIGRASYSRALCWSPNSIGPLPYRTMQRKCTI